jgi:hypothetical protein
MSKGPNVVPVLDRRKLKHTAEHEPRYYIGSSKPDRSGTMYFLEVLDSNFGLVLVGLDEVLIPGIDYARLEEIAPDRVPVTVREKLQELALEANA